MFKPPSPRVPRVHRTDCVPGYVARADATPPVWRCSVHGWNLQMDDMMLPWWNWQSLEKMHIESWMNHLVTRVVVWKMFIFHARKS